ncbi:MAG: segregation/condensation protein A [Lachnospiraceae bacterium]|nr:segregation/condensation protein A [Lachnospiraceae bacterium]
MAIPVKLPVFEGPLDLLMHLIEKNKIDIYDIPIVEITDQYLEYIHQMDREDLDVTSEFLVMAATLLDIKSRMLLPREKNEETGEEEGDPREELVRRLVEYKMYKYLSEELAVYREQAGVRYFRQQKLPKEVLHYQPPINYDELFKGTDLQSLQKVFGEVLRRKKSRRDPIRSGFGKIKREEVSIDTKMLYIRAYLQAHPHTDFRALLESRESREEVIVTFLILLELMKTQKIHIVQDTIGGRILVEATSDPAAEENAGEEVFTEIADEEAPTETAAIESVDDDAPAETAVEEVDDEVLAETAVTEDAEGDAPTEPVAEEPTDSEEPNSNMEEDPVIEENEDYFDTPDIDADEAPVEDEEEEETPLIPITASPDWEAALEDTLLSEWQESATFENMSEDAIFEAAYDQIREALEVPAENAAEEPTEDTGEEPAEDPWEGSSEDTEEEFADNTEETPAPEILSLQEAPDAEEVSQPDTSETEEAPSTDTPETEEVPSADTPEVEEAPSTDTPETEEVPSADAAEAEEVSSGDTPEKEEVPSADATEPEEASQADAAGTESDAEETSSQDVAGVEEISEPEEPAAQDKISGPEEPAVQDELSAQEEPFVREELSPQEEVSAQEGPVLTEETTFDKTLFTGAVQPRDGDPDLSGEKSAAAPEARGEVPEDTKTEDTKAETIEEDPRPAVIMPLTAFRRMEIVSAPVPAPLAETHERGIAGTEQTLPLPAMPLAEHPAEMKEEVPADLPKVKAEMETPADLPEANAEAEAPAELSEANAEMEAPAVLSEPNAEMETPADLPEAKAETEGPADLPEANVETEVSADDLSDANAETEIPANLPEEAASPVSEHFSSHLWYGVPRYSSGPRRTYSRSYVSCSLQPDPVWMRLRMERLWARRRR